MSCHLRSEKRKLLRGWVCENPSNHLSFLVGFFCVVELQTNSQDVIFGPVRHNSFYFIAVFHSVVYSLDVKVGLELRYPSFGLYIVIQQDCVEFQVDAVL